ncbi:hypothetical protein IOK49_06030 [Fervidicoccus fontis]|uniref:Uncharacterized protein n=1 Tax=Fervidicoccus fontis TaxID=683846 RepID=A0A2J6N3S7_9CREN|nr:hypothetical protein [Fervidicoccus fontis]PMB75979.1 MAG: hypothetical protein C0188_00885 [Fervidicoccus fontis]PMB77866.1 MAG: hypothetical protein C0177_01970 [Fervidicoccus fontis]
MKDEKYESALKMSLNEKEITERLCVSLTSYLSCCIINEEYADVQTLIKIVRNLGLENILEVKSFYSSLGSSEHTVIVVRFKVQVCEKKCENTCGSRESECFGKCFFECIEEYKKMAKEKLCGSE